MKNKTFEPPSKDEIIKAVRECMMEIGIAKNLWLEALELPEAEFDEALDKATKDAEHVAKGDKEGIKFALAMAIEESIEDLREMIDEVEDHADSNKKDKQTRVS